MDSPYMAPDCDLSVIVPRCGARSNALRIEGPMLCDELGRNATWNTMDIVEFRDDIARSFAESIAANQRQRPVFILCPDLVHRSRSQVAVSIATIMIKAWSTQPVFVVVTDATSDRCKKALKECLVEHGLSQELLITVDEMKRLCVTSHVTAGVAHG